jgi:Holliday junction resolvasome RuvABC endonuclease subunit
MDLKIGDIVAIEGYAFAAMGKVFTIAEATFPIKMSIYNNGNKLRIYEPTAIKKFSVGNGIAGKDLMEKEFTKRFGFLDKLLGENPKSDIIDAWFCCELLTAEIMLRKGFKTLKDFSDKQIEVFNQTSKANKDNFLVRNFLQKE